jgi:hypothetical protein
LSGVGGLPIGVFELAVIVRALILVACVVTWVRRREEAPVPADRGAPALAGARA